LYKYGAFTFDGIAGIGLDFFLGENHVGYQAVESLRPQYKRRTLNSMHMSSTLAASIAEYIVSESSYVYDTVSAYHGSRLQIKPTTPFKRVSNLTDYPSVLSTLTMLKVHLGEEFRPYSGANNCLVPLGDKYISDLETVYCYENRYGDFDMGFLCLSK
jgi:hypothetical protein